MDLFNIRNRLKIPLFKYLSIKMVWILKTTN